MDKKQPDSLVPQLRQHLEVLFGRKRQLDRAIQHLQGSIAYLEQENRSGVLGQAEADPYEGLGPKKAVEKFLRDNPGGHKLKEITIALESHNLNTKAKELQYGVASALQRLCGEGIAIRAQRGIYALRPSSEALHKENQTGLLTNEDKKQALPDPTGRARNHEGVPE